MIQHRQGEADGMGSDIEPGIGNDCTKCDDLLLLLNDPHNAGLQRIHSTCNKQLPQNFQIAARLSSRVTFL